MTTTTETPLTRVILYTDGSCLKNPGRGGWAAILTTEDGRAEKVISGGLDRTTNNRMEITAVLEGLKLLKRPCQVTVITDSQYVANSISKRWVWGWARRGWRDKEGKPRLNTDLWQEMLMLLDRHKVTMCWIRGHAGHPQNERCDELAKAAASQPNLPVDKAYLDSKKGPSAVPGSLLG